MVATVSPLPPAPSRGEDPADFNDKADALVGALPGLVTQVNAVSTEVNAKATSAASAAATATAKAAEAAAWAATAVASAPAYDSGSTYDFPQIVAFLIDGQTYRAMGPVGIGEAPSVAPTKWVKLTHNGTPDDSTVSPAKLSAGGPSWNTSGDATVARDLLITRDAEIDRDLIFGGGSSRTASIILKSGPPGTGAGMQYDRALDKFILWIGDTPVFSLDAAGSITSKGGQRVPLFLPSGAALPSSDIGVIWHADFNSWMTWQAFTANGASYTGYASVDVGRMIPDSQPTPRTGRVKTGSMTLSKTTYPQLWAWAQHVGVVVPVINWTQGMNAYADNGDGTFRGPDLRGEWSRIWDDGRGVDSGRAFTSWKDGQMPSHDHSYTDIYFRKLSTTSSSSGPFPGNEYYVMFSYSGIVDSYLTKTTGAAGGTTNSSENRTRGFAQLGSIQV